MSRAKLLIAACFTVFAFSALASASASAATGWDVNGTLLVGTKALASTALVLSLGTLSSAGVEIQCKDHEILIKNGFIRHPDEIIAEDLTFHECQTIGASHATCELSNPLILTLPIHGLAILDPGSPLNTLIAVLPLPTKTFTVLKFEGESCAVLGTQPVTGGIDLLIHGGIHPEVLHLVLAFSLEGSLKLGSGAATLKEVDIDLKLASGETWNFL